MRINPLPGESLQGIPLLVRGYDLAFSSPPSLLRFLQRPSPSSNLWILSRGAQTRGSRSPHRRSPGQKNGFFRAWIKRPPAPGLNDQHPCTQEPVETTLSPWSSAKSRTGNSRDGGSCPSSRSIQKTPGDRRLSVSYPGWPQNPVVRPPHPRLHGGIAPGVWLHHPEEGFSPSASPVDLTRRSVSVHRLEPRRGGRGVSSPRGFWLRRVIGAKTAEEGGDSRPAGVFRQRAWRALSPLHQREGLKAS